MRAMLLLALAGCSSTGTVTGDGGGPDGSTPGMTCPSAVPADGSACGVTVGMFACEYGGNAFGQCATLADCYAGKWHVTGPSPGCGMNPMGCPASFNALAEGSACPIPSGECFYPEGGCACAPCETDAGMMSGQWKCRAWSSAGTGCPSPRPLLGTACTSEGVQCDWGGCCTGVSLGANAQCNVSGACSCAQMFCK